ncbi:MAG: polysaccharide deacetylase family protein [Gemmatimonadota bacterium]
MERDQEMGAVLTAWAAAGYPLGNHTWSHWNLNQASAAEFEAEIVRSEETLQRFGRGGTGRWLRYPFLAEGDDPARRDLEGLESAYLEDVREAIKRSRRVDEGPADA